MQLSGAVVVVTGGASGLGAAAAQEFAAAGARVAVWDRDLARASAVAEGIGGIASAVDVTQSSTIESALIELRAQLGVPRVLVHCAGVSGGWKTAGSRGPHPEAEFRRLVDVNLVGTFNVCRLVAQAMLDNKPAADGERGILITTSSIAAYDGQVGQLAYAASKGGVASMTLVMARDLAAVGIRAVCIAPGLFETPMTAALTPEQRAAISASVPFPPGFGAPSTYGRLAIAICGNPMLNGTVVRLDGGARLPAR
jgi:NAD(P)-dependent dehydrogenase (short-subunit alcohol dehydrogenase family)